MQRIEDLELKALGQFIGTTKYIRHSLTGFLYTEGIQYLTENGYAWLVDDILIQLRFNARKVNIEPFIAVKLVVDQEKKTAEVQYSDGNDNVHFVQKYGYTSAKKDLTLFFVDNVLMLAGEY